MPGILRPTHRFTYIDTLPNSHTAVGDPVYHIVDSFLDTISEFIHVFENFIPDLSHLVPDTSIESANSIQSFLGRFAKIRNQFFYEVPVS